MKKKIEKKLDLLKDRIKYYFQKQHYVYMCMVNYRQEPFIRFGSGALNEPYKKEYEMKNGIYKRELESGNIGYRPYKRGKYCALAYNILKENQTLIVTYHPTPWRFRLRDEMLEELFIRTQYGISVFESIADDEYEDGKISLEQFNDHIRKSNAAKLELEQLIKKYCFTNI